MNRLGGRHDFRLVSCGFVLRAAGLVFSRGPMNVAFFKRPARRRRRAGHGDCRERGADCGRNAGARVEDRHRCLPRRRRRVGCRGRAPAPRLDCAERARRRVQHGDGAQVPLSGAPPPFAVRAATANAPTAERQALGPASTWTRWHWHASTPHQPSSRARAPGPRVPHDGLDSGDSRPRGRARSARCTRA